MRDADTHVSDYIYFVGGNKSQSNIQSIFFFPQFNNINNIDFVRQCSKYLVNYWLLCYWVTTFCTSLGCLFNLFFF